MSNFALNKVTISEAAELLMANIVNAVMNKKVALNACLHGSPGLGKSAIVQQLAVNLKEKLGLDYTPDVIDVRLGGMDSADVQGIPYVSETGIKMQVTNHTTGEVFETTEKDMFFSTPAWFPRDGKVSILFLDELLNAPIHVQHAAYRIILDRTVQNGTKLPDTCAIIAAGNLKSDKTGAKPLAPAAANRFGLHLEIDAQRAAESFIEHAVSVGFDQNIAGYLNWKPDHTFKTPNSEEAAFPTPRSWEMVSQHMANDLIANDHRFLRIAIAGAVGSAAATDFMGFLEFNERLPDWKKVRAGEPYTVSHEDGGMMYNLSNSLAFQIIDALKEANAIKSGEYNGEKTAEAVDTELGFLCDISEQLKREARIIMFKTIKSAGPDVKSAIIRNPRLRAQFSPLASIINGTR
jgi:MoxR-like ATPase